MDVIVEVMKKVLKFEKNGLTVVVTKFRVHWRCPHSIHIGDFEFLIPFLILLSFEEGCASFQASDAASTKKVCKYSLISIIDRACNNNNYLINIFSIHWININPCR